MVNACFLKLSHKYQPNILMILAQRFVHDTYWQKLTTYIKKYTSLNQCPSLF